MRLNSDYSPALFFRIGRKGKHGPVRMEWYGTDGLAWTGLGKRCGSVLATGLNPSRLHSCIFIAETTTNFSLLDTQPFLEISLQTRLIDEWNQVYLICLCLPLSFNLFRLPHNAYVECRSQKRLTWLFVWSLPPSLTSSLRTIFNAMSNRRAESSFVRLSLFSLCLFRVPHNAIWDAIIRRM